MEICLNEIQRSPFEELSASFKYVETIAHGAFGTVVLAEDVKTKQEVAVKILNKSMFKLDAEKIREEIVILKQLDHPNILKFYDYFETTNYIFIIMEYISKTTLRTFLTLNKNHISEETASTIMKHLLTAIQYIHSKSICHRDIKPENVMFKDVNDLSSLKLIDFGLSARHDEYFMKPEFCGTFIYMSPEQIENKTYTQGVDVWSAGVVLYLLLNQGTHPFYAQGDTKKKYIAKIKACTYKPVTTCSEMALLMLNAMLEPNPQTRISAQTALKHPWITRRMLDDLPHNVIEGLTRSSAQHKLQNAFILALFMKHFSTEHTRDRPLDKADHEYEKKLQVTNREGNEYFKTKRMNMFRVITAKDSYDATTANVKLTDNNEHETTHINSITSTSLVSSRAQRKSNLSTSKQKLYVFNINTPRKTSTKEVYSANALSLIKRSYSTFEVKCTRNAKNCNIKTAKLTVKVKTPSAIASSPLQRQTYTDEQTIYKFQRPLRSNFSPVKTKATLFALKQPGSSKKQPVSSSTKKEIQSPFSSRKLVNKMSFFQFASKKDNLYPLILPSIKIKAAQHLSNKQTPLRHIN